MSSPWPGRSRVAGRSDVAPGEELTGRIALVTEASVRLAGPPDLWSVDPAGLGEPLTGDDLGEDALAAP
jgi:hypothetical protein